MKAFVLHGVNDLRYDEIPLPECPVGWALVQVKAAGICSSDIARIFTKGTYHFPTVPGHEFAGVVCSVGDAQDSFLVGKRVGVFPLIPCRKCPQCAEKKYEMCKHYDYVGSRRDGGFAEYVSVPVWNLIPLDDNISFTSAAMLEPLCVALHACKLLQIEVGQSVGIIGTGMIAISAAQWALAQGAAQVTIIGRNESKRERIELNGINYSVCIESDKVNLFDAVLEAVGTQSAIDLSIHAAKPGARLVLMGNPDSDILFSQNTYWRILRKQLSLQGTWNSSYDNCAPSDWTEAIDSLVRGVINVSNLISHSFPQERLMDGLQLMREHCVPFCKVMTVWNE